MKIDESVIDKVLDNKAAPGEARKVAGWFVTEGKLDVKEPIYKYIPPPRYKTRPLQQPCLNKLVSPLFQPPEAMNVFS
jgi:hypothetical protein